MYKQKNVRQRRTKKERRSIYAAPFLTIMLISLNIAQHDYMTDSQGTHTPFSMMSAV